VIRMPHSRHVARESAPRARPAARPAARRGLYRIAASGATVRPARVRLSFAGRAVVLAGTVAFCAAVLPAGTASAASTAPARSASNNPTLDATLAKANALSEQIDVLSQQYDSLKIQLTQAQAEVTLAKQNALRDQSIFAQDQGSIAAIAVENYMTGGMSPALQLLSTASPQSLLDRASIMTQLSRENGARVSLVADAEADARRAEAAAAQQQQRASNLAAQMKSKVSAIQQKENFFNSQAFAQAASIFEQTGSYPDIKVSGDSIGVQALRFALTRIGDPYVWGAAGPSSFDCSGLVMWAYAQIGISLMHFTGDQWNEGEHISRDQLEPGDLVFFYSDLGHVGIYVGNGLMVDAPTFGIPVHVEPIFWQYYEGAVRIVA
jgi:peptidoglycan DL-endopeptidase CwlO